MKRHTRRGATTTATAMLYSLVLALALATSCVEATTSSSSQSSPDLLRRAVRSQSKRQSSSFWKARHVLSPESDSWWDKRQAAPADQAGIAAQGEVDPFGAALAADNQPYIRGNYSGGDNNPASLTPTTGDFQQLPWNINVYFQQSASTNGSENAGWQELPETPGFILNRTVAIPNSDNSGSGIMPFYITENTLTPASVKRAIMMWPGKPRDAWNYANLMMNARSVVAENFASWGITNDSVLILAPVFMDSEDMTAGAGHPGEISFGGELWQKGSPSKTPTLTTSITSYEIMDYFADMLFNKVEYPNLNQVVVVGHSLGGQASMRYGLLKRTKYYDNNMRFWIGNPGSWTWLSDQRPYPNANMSCLANTSTSYESWPYGISGNLSEITKYARKNVETNATYVVERFLRRKVAYGLALLDNGPGDTRCQAQWQGANHLDRGSQFILAYQNLSVGNNQFPVNHTVDFIAEVSHQDYPMYSTNMSLQRIFNDDFNVRYPDITNTTSPGDSTHNSSEPTARPYATPIHEKVAVGLLIGTLVLLILIFTIVPYIFRENFDDTWEREMKLSTPNYQREGTVSSMTHLLHKR